MHSTALSFTANSSIENEKKKKKKQFRWNSTFLCFRLSRRHTRTQIYWRRVWKMQTQYLFLNATNTITIRERVCGNPIWEARFENFVFPLPLFFFSLLFFMRLCRRRRRLSNFQWQQSAMRKSNVHRVYWTADRPYLLVSPLLLIHTVLMHSHTFCISFHSDHCLYGARDDDDLCECKCVCVRMRCVWCRLFRFGMPSTKWTFGCQFYEHLNKNRQHFGRFDGYVCISSGE